LFIDNNKQLLYDFIMEGDEETMAQSNPIALYLSANQVSILQDLLAEQLAAHEGCQTCAHAGPETYGMCMEAQALYDLTVGSVS
jgi:hypothetical protein